MESEAESAPIQTVSTLNDAIPAREANPAELGQCMTKVLECNDPKLIPAVTMKEGDAISTESVKTEVFFLFLIVIQIFRKPNNRPRHCIFAHVNERTLLLPKNHVSFRKIIASLERATC